MPGFVDAHNHASQYSYTGVGYDMGIDDRLQEYKIPTEAKFADVEVAKKTYPCAVVQFVGTLYIRTVEPLINELTGMDHFANYRLFWR